MYVLADGQTYYGFTGLTMTAAYQWDNEGRMTSLQYPTVKVGIVNWPQLTMPTAAYQYDINGRLSAMTMDSGNGYGPRPFASATYTPARQLQTLWDAAGTETRQYNSLMQLTSHVYLFGHAKQRTNHRLHGRHHWREHNVQLRFPESPDQRVEQFVE